MDIEIVEPTERERGGDLEIAALREHISSLEDTCYTLRMRLSSAERERNLEQQQRQESEEECFRLRKRMFAWSVRILQPAETITTCLNDAERAAGLHYSRSALALAEWAAAFFAPAVLLWRWLPRSYFKARVWYRYVFGVAWFRATGCRIFQPHELPPDQYRTYRAAGGI